MTDSAFKVANMQGKLGKSVPRPSAKNVRGSSPMGSVPADMIASAQDSVPASSRCPVAIIHVSGDEAWAVDDGTDPDAAGQHYPEVDTWRTVGTFESVLTPGTFLEAHVVAAPSGMTERNNGAWVSAGASGAVRVAVVWTGRSTNTATTHTLVLPGSLGTWGAAPSGAGSDWPAMIERVIPEIRPANVGTVQATLEEYSHLCRATITVSVQGGARPQSIVVYEAPYAHAQDHDSATLEAVHAYTVGQTPAKISDHTSGPRAKAADGATYDEQRFGTDQILRAADVQIRRLGPHLLSWTSWASDPGDQIFAAQAALLITSASYVDIFDASITSWGEDNPGLIVSCPYAQVAEWCDPDTVLLGKACAVPVRIDAIAAWIDQGGGTCTIKIQSSAVSMHVLSVTSATPSRVTAYGFLEGQVYADQFRGVLQVFARSTTGDVEIYDLSIRFHNPER